MIICHFLAPVHYLHILFVNVFFSQKKNPNIAMHYMGPFYRGIWEIFLQNTEVLFNWNIFPVIRFTPKYFFFF